jgi:ribosomal protein S18 acetylase RimI-like enzyme
MWWSISTQIVTADPPAIEAVDPLPLRAELREVHRAALGAGALSDEWADNRLPDHVRRDDFLFLVAREAGQVVGFAYGYRGRYGHWWTEHVALALSPAARAEWLDVPHYEVVELHVHPAWQRVGIGTALLTELLSRQPYDRVLLSTQAGSRQARAFYAGNGWRELAPVDFGTGYPPYLVLGQHLEDSARAARAPAGEGYLPATDET